jgi:AcrR family transcriptional regulator
MSGQQQEEHTMNLEELLEMDIHPDVREFFTSIPKEMLPPEDPSSPEARILRSAREIFADRGFEGASTREIADHADVNQAMIHYYFRSKKGLYKKILHTQFLMMFAAIAARLKPETTSEEFVCDMPLRIIDVLRTSPTISKLFRRELAAGAETLKEVLRDTGEYGPAGFRERLKARYEEGLASGRLRELDFDGLSQLLITIGYTSIVIDPLFEQISGTTLHDDETWEKRRPVFAAILRHGIQTHSGEES